MLTRLSIRNIVLIEALDLDFGKGLGVLTGETGAGKSILLDALGLVLGNRAESALVRAGADKAVVTASFEFGALPASVGDAIEDAGVEIEPGEPLVVRRQLKADGGSKAWLNDQPVGAAQQRLDHTVVAARDGVVGERGERVGAGEHRASGADPVRFGE